MYFELDAACAEFLADGHAARFDLYRSRNRRLRQGLAQLGMPSFTNTGAESSSIVTCRIPEGVAYEALYDTVKERGIIVYGCKGVLADRYMQSIELALSACVRAVEAGRRPALVLPNPDLVYPKGDGELGFTAGAMALLIEAALARRFPTANLAFDRLGKPAPHLLLEGKRRLGLERVVMIGDQLETDVAGARAAGLDVALLAGVSRWNPNTAIVPTYLLDRLAPG